MKTFEFDAVAMAGEYTDIDAIKRGDALPYIFDSKLAQGLCQNNGYSVVGTAKVTLVLASDEDMVARKVEALQSQLQAHRAEAQQKENCLLEKISKLQALTYSA